MNQSSFSYQQTSAQRLLLSVTWNDDILAFGRCVKAPSSSFRPIVRFRARPCLRAHVQSRFRTTEMLDRAHNVCGLHRSRFYRRAETRSLA
jgi:hypothetical protein